MDVDLAERLIMRVVALVKKLSLAWLEGGGASSSKEI